LFCFVLFCFVGTLFWTGTAVGDVLVVCSCLFFALSNLGQEYLVKSYSRLEFQAMIGGFGALISLIQLLCLETGHLAGVNWTGGAVGWYWTGFTVRVYLWLSLGLGLGLQLWLWFVVAPINRGASA
jgi:hypothetical protein